MLNHNHCGFPTTYRAWVSTLLLGCSLAQAQQVEEVIIQADYIPDEKLTTSEISDVLDAEDMSIAGDGDIGAALKRLPGLSLVDGKFVYVRGLGERYSTTYVNGTPLPSPEPLQRAVPLDLFDTSIAKNVLVQKTYSANYGIEFSGGVVDIRTAGVPDEGFFNVKLSTAYNDISTGKSGLGYDGGGRDWLGADDGARDLPRVVDRNLDNYRNLIGNGSVISGDEQDAITISFNNTWEPERSDNPYDGSIALSSGNRFQVSDSLNLGFIATASLGNTWRNRLRRETRYDYRDIAGQDPADVRAIFDNIDSIRDRALDGTGTEGVIRVTNREITQHEINRNLLLAVGAEYQDQHYINYTIMQARKSSDNTVVGIEADGTEEPEEPERFQQLRLSWTENEILFQQLAGEHYFDVVTVKWRYALIDSERQAPDTRLVERRIQDDGSLILTDANRPTRLWTELDDSSKEYGVDVELPLFSSLFEDASLKFGYAKFDQERVFDTYQFAYETLRLSFADRALPLETLTDSSSCAVGAPASTADDCYLYTGAGVGAPDTGHLFLREGFFGVEEIPDGFIGEFETEANYLIFDAQLTESLRMSIGRRSERSFKFLTNPATGEPIVPLNELDDFRDGTKTLEELISPPTAKFNLNSTSLTWDFYANMILRASYSETVNRPVLRELSSIQFYDPEDDREYVGSPRLEIARIYNSELRYEWYYGLDNYFGASLYRKSFSRPVEIEETDGEDPFLTWANLDKAETQGVELQVRHYLNDYWQVTANATLSSSKVRDTRVDAPVFDGDRPMQGHSEELYNLQIVYQDDQFTASLAYNHFSERLRGLFNADGKNKHAVYEQPFDSLDFNFKAKFYTDGSEFEVGFKVQNILDEKVKYEAALLAPAFELISPEYLRSVRAPYEDWEVGVTYSLSVGWRQY